MSDEPSTLPIQSGETTSGPATPPDAPPPAGWSPARIFFCVSLVSLLISVGSVYLYDRFIAQKVVAVDLQGFLAEQKESYMRGEIDAAELERRMDHLELVVAAIPQRYAVVLRDVVIRNVEVIKP